MKIHRHSLGGFLGVALLTVATLIVGGIVFFRIVIPGYTNPTNRTYTSRLGYPALLRMRDQAFPVTLATVQERNLGAHLLGEGLVQSEPVLVPLVPTARISRVLVHEGDRVRKGQLLAELDSGLAELRILEARTAIEVAKVLVERTKLGSVSVMPQERPELDEVRLAVAQKEAALAKDLVGVYERLTQQGAEPLELLLKQKLELAKSLGDVETARVELSMSRPGKPLSIRSAQLEVERGELKLRRLQRELKDYKIYALDDGVIDQVLIHEGELKQGNGTPAFTLSVGRWFNAYLDQTAIGRFDEGTPVNVRLEAFPGRVFRGHVAKIKPIVNYSQGGPEAIHPIRPLGTGSPEWPATFEARVVLEGDLKNVVPGLTGFAEVRLERRALAVPSGALTSVSGGKAIAYVAEGDQFRPQAVTTGISASGWTEVLAGLDPGAEVIFSGHAVLQPGDRIVATERNVHPDEIDESKIVDVASRSVSAMEVARE